MWSKTAANTTAVHFCYAAADGGGHYRAVLITAFSILKHFSSSMAAVDNVVYGGQSKFEEKSLLPPCKGACDV